MSKTNIGKFIDEKGDTLSTQYLAALEKQNYWRLFVDGFRQRSSYGSKDTKEDFNEFELGPLLWSLREPNGLKKLKETAIRLYSRDMNEALTFEFMDKLIKSVYPFEDHLRLATSYISTNGPRMFGHITEPTEMEWILSRGKNIQKLVNSYNAPWSLQRSPQDAVEILVEWTLTEKLDYYPKILECYNENMHIAETPKAKIEFIAQLMQDIECLHFFSDGNCRMMYLLLNKELMRHEESPVILLNPNFFDQMPLDDLYTEIIEGQAAYKKCLDIARPYDDCLEHKDIIQNINKLALTSEIAGDNDFTFAKSLEFTQETLIIFNDVLTQVEIIKPSSFAEFAPFWNSVLRTLLAYEAFKAFKAESNVLCKGFYTSKNCEDFSKFIEKPGMLDDPKMEYITSYLELLNYEHVKDYIFSKAALEDSFNLETVINSTKEYLEKLLGLSSKYAKEYTLESFLNLHLVDIIDNTFPELGEVAGALADQNPNT
jgi:hypothetical protein